MQDRELLELAAKAAGLKIDKSPYNGGGSGNTGFDAMGNAVLDWHNNVSWNPLTDDGDALRLAVKLRLLVECGYMTVNVRYNWDEVERWSLDDSGINETVLDFNGIDGGQAATRRAIVRAAAEIGKAIKGGSDADT